MSAEGSDGPADPPKKTRKDAENQGTENVVTKYFNTAVAIVTDPVGTAINTLSGVGKLASEMITNKEDVGSFILRKANEAYDSYLYRIKYSQDPEYEFHVVMAELKTEISLMIASEGAVALAGETLNGIRALRAVKTVKSTVQWNLGESVVTISHYNWSKIFGDRKISVSDVQPIVEIAVKHGSWKVDGVYRGRKGVVAGDRLIMNQRIQGHTIWVEGMRSHSTGTIIIKNAGVK
ncbi:hypothetical protein [Paenimyroides baculatum]|uniref:Uncharacterized protein n=1 Tax=Paenimyroides baculatum TaxID=2608000 RepID=A0A5M6CKL1_9FLAO|nr:hypothetical protein [Paenimyroides baculatum]KAA5535573.1 hypothetical protein F0460_07265 [Paenimyroides baculatum]